VKWSGPGDPHLLKPVSGTVQFLKLPHEINAQISHVHTIVADRCSRCLKPIECKVSIDFAEREFIINLPERDLEEGEERKFVNRETAQIDLNDMIREELLLHYPFIPVCSESCKGLCSKCGINFNEKTCDCIPDVETRMNPFRFL
jgi:uncharacterized protein